MQRSCRQIPANVSLMTTVYDRKYEYQGHQKMHDFTFIFPHFLFLKLSTDSVKWIQFLGGFLGYKQQENHPSRFLFITFPIRFAWH